MTKENLESGMFRIESLLSARLFLSPQLVGEQLYFISNLSGQLSLYVMDYGGSVPEPLLPSHIALQNPELIGGYSFKVFPQLEKILVMIDRDGDENYQPMLVPLKGGFPQPAFGSQLDNTRVHLGHTDVETGQVYIGVESRQEAMASTYIGDLNTGKLTLMSEGQWGNFPVDVAPDHQTVLLAEGYTTGDTVLFRWQPGQPERQVLMGVPIDQRKPGEPVALNGLVAAQFTADGAGVLMLCALYEDTYSPAYFDLETPADVQPVKLEGIVHQGAGEMTDLRRLENGRYTVSFNIDGCSWLYEANFDRPSLTLKLGNVLVGSQPPLQSGVLEAFNYDAASDRYALAFSTAIFPTQLFTVEGPDRSRVVAHTREKVLGIAPELLSPGEDASFISHDGLRVSARLYMPAAPLGFSGPRPLVVYVHGGPQGQERPDFAWFSMPLIQFLALNGFAVFVPNVRGSTGYGLSYTKHVDRDWGGQDRLDHVHALTVLEKDARLNTHRAAVVGRSYGGYMTLTLAARHPELWSAACDMFGPFDLITFSERIPETWKPYFRIALGDPQQDRPFLVERSPKTYIDNVACPLLVIQGKNDPRVVEQESRDLVEYLRGQGKQVEYLMFENEGHDVLKYENRVRCYNTITDFFRQHLMD
jgi:pimeloyl-ACP methyl ester carboxylesterase